MRKFADASVTIHSADGNVEIACKVLGPAEDTLIAVKALCECVSEGLLSKLGSNVHSTVFCKQSSEYPILDINTILRNHRMFVLNKISEN